MNLLQGSSVLIHVELNRRLKNDLSDLFYRIRPIDSQII